MNISYNWLKEYLHTDKSAQDIATILTSVGLEVEAIEEYCSIKGGLEGVVVGKVLTCQRHPNADKLSLTTVDVAGAAPLHVVCGAPNVAAGQTVLVATIGTKLYSGDSEFVIKESKIRGELSQGMICAEDELGLGTSHDGIMVLPNSIVAGTPAKDYFGIETDTVFVVGLTPNRADAASHIGVARDLAAYLRMDIRKPGIDTFAVENNSAAVQVHVADETLCPRYMGVSISGVKVAESPKWLQNRLKAIGLKPINNIVDITNFVLHETGQPLHAFDLAKIAGKRVEVKTCAKGTKFTTLDGVERELDATDLMICNAEAPMCIAGVFGGQDSGISANSTEVFLESAYFNSVSVRKSARRHLLYTDASFRFERGVDPNGTAYALKRAALLIKAIAGGTISSDIFDSHPQAFPSFAVSLSFNKVRAVIGKQISDQEILDIILALDIVIETNADGVLQLQVPCYRVDVQRAEDVIEDILRIYGYNNVEIPTTLNSSITYQSQPDENKLRNVVSDLLSSNGFTEIMNNSLTRAEYYTSLPDMAAEELVYLSNPLSAELNVMRRSLLFGGLETVAYNINRQTDSLRMYEFGRTYQRDAQKKGFEQFTERIQFALWLTGSRAPRSWNVTETSTDYYQLKSFVEMVLRRMAVPTAAIERAPYKSSLLNGLEYSFQRKPIARFGLVSKGALKQAGIDQAVYYAEICWDTLIALYQPKTKFKELPKFFEVRRDLSLLIDATVQYEQLQSIAQQTERKYLKDVQIFDVYQGKGVPEGKKSYAISFVLQDPTETLKDSKIDGIMNNIMKAYREKLGAEQR